MAKVTAGNKATTRNKAPRLGEICEVLETIAPLSLAQDWDNVGLLAGNRDARARRVLLCIDLTPPVVAEAVRRRADLVVAYHPPIFRPVRSLVGPSDRMEAQVLRCLTKGIAIYSPHTALDAAPGGTNDVLAQLCEMVDPRPLEPVKDDPAVGMGRIGMLARPLALEQLVRALRRRTRGRCVSFVGDRERKVRRAVVVVGAAGDLPFAIDLRRDDVIVTGEIRHHDALRILRVGCSAVALSHWSSERPALAALGRRLEQLMPGLDVALSDEDREPFVRA